VHTSLGLDRTIDYALTVEIEISIQTYEGFTTRYHKRIICTLTYEGRESTMASRTNRDVFSPFFAYTFRFWAQQWNPKEYNMAYELFVELLVGLFVRYTSHFALKKARSPMPVVLKALIVRSRAGAFESKHKGSLLLHEEARYLLNISRTALRRFQ
jgi:hypothetical protein